jgi:hypothetical protein
MCTDDDIPPKTQDNHEDLSRVKVQGHSGREDIHPNNNNNSQKNGMLGDGSEGDEYSTIDEDEHFPEQPDHVIHFPRWTSFTLSSDRDEDVDILVRPLCGYRVAVPCLADLSSRSRWKIFDDMDLRSYDRSSPDSDAHLESIISLWLTVLDRMIKSPLYFSQILIGILVLRQSYSRWYALCVQKCVIKNKIIQRMFQTCIERCQIFDQRLEALKKISSYRDIMIAVGYCMPNN